MSTDSGASSEGVILSDGKCGGDGKMFKGIAARYLGELYEMDASHVEYRDFLQRSADASWKLARDPATGNITCDWAGPYDDGAAGVGSLGSAAVGLAAAARALGAGKQRPALEYEAEEGDLYGIGLESSHAGFSGWGYVAGWGGDGQSLDLLIEVPDAASYEMTFRYATGDDARRSVGIDGNEIAATFGFPSTGSYDAYATVALTVPLAPGKHVLTVAYQSGKAGQGYLNLDQATLVKK